MMKSPAVLVHPALDVTHPPVQHIHSCIHFPPISHWVITLLVSRHAAAGSLHLHSNNPYLMQQRPQHAAQCLRCAKRKSWRHAALLHGSCGLYYRCVCGKKSMECIYSIWIQVALLLFFLELGAKTRTLGLFYSPSTTELNPHTYLYIWYYPVWDIH